MKKTIEQAIAIAKKVPAEQDQCWPGDPNHDDVCTLRNHAASRAAVEATRRLTPWNFDGWGNVVANVKRSAKNHNRRLLAWLIFGLAVMVGILWLFPHMTPESGTTTTTPQQKQTGDFIVNTDTFGSKSRQRTQIVLVAAGPLVRIFDSARIFLADYFQ